MYVIHKGGSGRSARTRPLDGGRTQNAALFRGDSASRGARMACNWLFLGPGRRLVPAPLSWSRSRSVHAGRRATRWLSWTLHRQNRQTGPKVCCVRCHVKTLGAGASELRCRRHRCDRPRNANESAGAKSAWRGLQPRPGSSGGPRSRQQPPIAAAGFISPAYGARRPSVLSSDRRRSRRSALAFGRGNAGHGVRQRFVQFGSRDPSLDRPEVTAATRFDAPLRCVWSDRGRGQVGCKRGFWRGRRWGGGFARSES
jgi:hypothetical protein